MEQPNLEYFIKLSNNNAAFKQKLIEVVKYELPLEIEEYHKYLAVNNMEKAAECVHKIKHKIGVLGMEKAYYQAEEYEDNLRNGSKKLDNVFEQTLEIINRFMKQI